MVGRVVSVHPWGALAATSEEFREVLVPLHGNWLTMPTPANGQYRKHCLCFKTCTGQANGWPQEMTHSTTEVFPGITRCTIDDDPSWYSKLLPVVSEASYGLCLCPL